MTRRSRVAGLGLAVFGLLSSGVAPLAAQDFVDLIRDEKQSFTLAASGAAGAGVEFVLGEARAAEFTVIGESHGNVETCKFTHWLLRELKAHGYGAYATETGPCTTDHLAAVARERGMAGVGQFMKRYPFTVAFLTMREEAELFVAAVQAGYEAWGIDQEFLGSPRLLLAELADRAESDAARQLAVTWRNRAMAGFGHYIESGDRSKAFMAVAGPADWRKLMQAFAKEPADVRRLLDELRESQRIYGLHQRGLYYENNHERIALMKRHLADRLRSAPETKAVLKFGAAHAGRGYSPFDQLDVGNHAAEAAVARGGDSFHVFVFARRSISKDGTKKDFVADADGLAPFYAAQGGDEGCVFDLRALRPIMSRDNVEAKYPAAHGLVFRFDALVLLPELHASTSMLPLPKDRR
ncbi:MAG: hypothetical protein NXI31_07025 [bacterium]|nr:hypothetical protein [bacterium]